MYTSVSACPGQPRRRSCSIAHDCFFTQIVVFDRSVARRTENDAGKHAGDGCTFTWDGLKGMASGGEAE